MTPSDRELIEWLATNVYGATIGRPGDDGPWPALWWAEDHDCYVLEREEGARMWNPLTSHDDAAMLEAKVLERGWKVEMLYYRRLRYRVGAGTSDEVRELSTEPITIGMRIARRAKPRQICEAIKAAWPVPSEA